MKIFKASYSQEELSYIVVAENEKHARILINQRTDDGAKPDGFWTFEEIKTNEVGVYFYSHHINNS